MRRRRAGPDGPDQGRSLEKGKQVAGFAPAAGRRHDRVRLLDLLRLLHRGRQHRWPAATTRDPRRHGRRVRTGPSPWPANRRILYNRASADLDGKPWDPTAASSSSGTATKWAGFDVPDIAPTVEARAGRRPFIMNPEGVARLFARGHDARRAVPGALRAVRGADRQRRRPEDPGQPGRARVQGRPGSSSATRQEFPYAATSYRLTEHFHYWTKHVRVNAVLQPEFFVEISEELAKEKGISQGRLGPGLVEARLDQGQGGRHQAHQAADLRRQDRPRRRHPASTGASWARPRRAWHPNSLTPFRGRRQHRDAGVQGVPGEHRAAIASGSGGLRGGADTWPTTAPSTSASAVRPRRRTDAPLGLDAAADGDRRSPSSSTCRNASAARPASRPAWSGTTCARRSASTSGVYDNPHDLTPNSGR